MALESASLQFSSENELNRSDDVVSPVPAIEQENYSESAKKGVAEVAKIRKSSKSDIDAQGYLLIK